MSDDASAAAPSSCLVSLLSLSHECLELYSSRPNLHLPASFTRLHQQTRTVHATLQTLQHTIQSNPSLLPPDLLSTINECAADLEAVKTQVGDFMQEQKTKAVYLQYVPLLKPFLLSFAPALSVYLALLPPSYFLLLLLSFVCLFYYSYHHLSFVRDLSAAWQDDAHSTLHDLSSSLEHHRKQLQRFLFLQQQLRDSRRYDVSRCFDRWPAALAYWAFHFGSECHSVATDRFIETLLFTSRMPTMADGVRKMVYATIQAIVDHNADGTVSPTEFAAFIQYFGGGQLEQEEATSAAEGETNSLRDRRTSSAMSVLPPSSSPSPSPSPSFNPLSRLCHNVVHGLLDLSSKPVSVYPWFSWRSMDREESSAALPNVAGTFLIRCSSQAGRFACDYVNQARELKHSIIENDLLKGYHFQSIDEHFATLADLVHYYMKKGQLRFPYLDPLQLVQLNVGGVMYEARLGLFLPWPATLLGEQLRKAQTISSSGSNSSNSSSSRYSPRLFLDRDSTSFRMILNWYRYGGELMWSDAVPLQLVLAEVEYFKLPITEEEVKKAWIIANEKGDKAWQLVQQYKQQQQQRSGRFGAAAAADKQSSTSTPFGSHTKSSSGNSTISSTSISSRPADAKPPSSRLLSAYSTFGNDELEDSASEERDSVGSADAITATATAVVAAIHVANAKAKAAAAIAAATAPSNNDSPQGTDAKVAPSSLDRQSSRSLLDDADDSSSAPTERPPADSVLMQKAMSMRGGSGAGVDSLPTSAAVSRSSSVQATVPVLEPSWSAMPAGMAPSGMGKGNYSVMREEELEMEAERETERKEKQKTESKQENKQQQQQPKQQVKAAHQSNPHLPKSVSTASPSTVSSGFRPPLPTSASVTVPRSSIQTTPIGYSMLSDEDFTDSVSSTTTTSTNTTSSRRVNSSTTLTNSATSLLTAASLSSSSSSFSSVVSTSASSYMLLDSSALQPTPSPTAPPSAEPVPSPSPPCSAASGAPEWEYYLSEGASADGAGCWCPYSRADNTSVNAAYSAFKAGGSQLAVQMGQSMYTYRLDFANMTQTNIASGKERPIRMKPSQRVAATDLPTSAPILSSSSTSTSSTTSMMTQGNYSLLDEAALDPSSTATSTAAANIASSIRLPNPADRPPLDSAPSLPPLPPSRTSSASSSHSTTASPYHGSPSPSSSSSSPSDRSTSLSSPSSTTPFTSPPARAPPARPSFLHSASADTPSSTQAQAEQTGRGGSGAGSEVDPTSVSSAAFPSHRPTIIKSSSLPTSPPSSAFASASSSDPSTLDMDIEALPCWRADCGRSGCQSLLASQPIGTYLFRSCSDASELIGGERNPNLFVLSYYTAANTLLHTKVYRVVGFGLSVDRPVVEMERERERDKGGKRREVPAAGAVLYRTVEALARAVVGEGAKPLE